MQTELNILESKLAQLVKLSQQLRTQNHQLRSENHQLRAGNHQLNGELAAALEYGRQSDGKIESARLRLEQLLAQLPEEES